MIASRYSVDQSSSEAASTRGSTACVAGSPRTAQPAAMRSPTRGARCVAAQGRVDQQRLGRAADAGAAHLGVDDDATRHGEVRRRMDIGVAEPVEMGEDRDARLRLHARDEALAAARHDDVERAVEAGEHGPDRGTVARRHELDRCSRKTGLGEPGAQRLGDDAAAAELSEPPRRIAALPALRQSAPASAVTLGRLSKITPITPSGVATRSKSSPFGVVQWASTRPTGSARPATASTPSAIAVTRASSRTRRSRKAGVWPAARACATSCALAARMRGAARRSSAAMARKAPSFCAAGRAPERGRPHGPRPDSRIAPAISLSMLRPSSAMAIIRLSGDRYAFFGPSARLRHPGRRTGPCRRDGSSRSGRESPGLPRWRGSCARRCAPRRRHHRRRCRARPRRLPASRITTASPRANEPSTRVTPAGRRLARRAAPGGAGVDMKRAARLEMAGEPLLARGDRVGGGQEPGAGSARLDVGERRLDLAGGDHHGVPPPTAIFAASTLVRMPPRDSSDPASPAMASIAAVMRGTTGMSAAPGSLPGGAV